MSDKPRAPDVRLHESHPMAELCHVAPQPQRGMLQAFVDLLDLALPERTTEANLRAAAAFHLARVSGFEPAWQPAAVARLLHLGLLVPEEPVAPTLAGHLPSTERDEYACLVGARILSHIESLTPLAEMMRHHRNPERIATPHLRRGAEIVRSAIALQSMMTAMHRGPSEPRGRCPTTLDGHLVGTTSSDTQEPRPVTGDATDANPPEIYELPVVRLQPHMVTAAEVLDRQGKVLLAKGYRLTPRTIALLMRAAQEGNVQEPILVCLTDDQVLTRSLK